MKKVFTILFEEGYYDEGDCLTYLARELGGDEDIVKLYVDNAIDSDVKNLKQLYLKYGYKTLVDDYGNIYCFNNDKEYNKFYKENSELVDLGILKIYK